MKKRMNIFLPMLGIAGFLLVAAGCGSDKDTPDSPSARTALQVRSGIQTRASNAEWAKDDAIGIYMLNSGALTVAEDTKNRPYIAQASGGEVAFQPRSADATIYYPMDGSSVDFCAYYPYRELANDLYELNVSDQRSLPAIDLMTAAAKEHDKDHAAVSFRFFHRLSKLELTIVPGNGVEASELEGLSVQITNQRVTGSYDLLYDTFGIDKETSVSVTLNTVSDGTSAEGILLPNDVDDNAPVTGRELVFTLKSGETFRWSIDDDKSFDCGDKNLYTITINRSSLEVTSGIEDWNAGNGTGESGSAE